MPATKSRTRGRFTGGVIISSGSVAKRVTELFAGSVLANSPSFGGGSLVGSNEQLSVAVTGLDASHLIIVTAASMPGGCVVLQSACAIIDKIETKWVHTASDAAAGCAITLNFLAWKDKAQ